MKKRKKRTKKISLFPRTACAVLFTAAYITALVWVHWHICRIEGSSMEPSYGNGDLVYTETLPEGSAPALGDVVILEPPEGTGGLSFLPWRTLLTKRVVGLPGDFLEVREDGLYRNGQRLSEPYVESWEEPEYLALELREGEYFVLGDNRDVSFDSRAFGPVKKGSFKRIIRKIFFGCDAAGTARASKWD